MSLAMPGNPGTTCLSAGSSLTSLRIVSTAALTMTIPASSSPRSAARRRQSAPPIERPTATTASFSAASLSYAPSTVATQSAHVTLFRSCHRVPWPGRRGISTAYPRAARSSAHGRIDTGLPVKPCCTSTPTRRPPVSSGFAGVDIGATRAGSSGGWGAPRNGIFTAHSVHHVGPRRAAKCSAPRKRRARWSRCERSQPRHASSVGGFVDGCERASLATLILGG